MGNQLHTPELLDVLEQFVSFLEPMRFDRASDDAKAIELDKAGRAVIAKIRATQPTPHGAPELPLLPARYSYKLEPNEDDLTPDDEIDVFTADQMLEYARAAIQHAVAVPEGRSDKDYAIEHAEYMAKAAEQLAYSVDALDAAHLLDGETPGGADDAVNEAQANYVEARKALSSCVYEFRKRRDRAATPAVVQPTQVKVDEDARRYRFLRDGGWRETALEPVIRLQLNELWDEKIDAAILTKGEGKS